MTISCPPSKSVFVRIVNLIAKNIKQPQNQGKKRKAAMALSHGHSCCITVPYSTAYPNTTQHNTTHHTTPRPTLHTGTYWKCYVRTLHIFGHTATHINYSKYRTYHRYVTLEVIFSSHIIIIPPQGSPALCVSCPLGSRVPYSSRKGSGSWST